jgi:ferredoxin--NADP+ reductase
MSPLGTDAQPLRVAIIGAGPAGFYAAERLLKETAVVVEVDLFDRLPTPYGLVRNGVAPDHQKIKSVTAAFEKMAANPRFRFFGNVELGRDLSVADLEGYYHQVLYSTGAQTDRPLGIPGDHLENSHPATEFVAWYNGHPDFRDCHFDLTQEKVAVVGIGNVAVDVARILVKSPDELAKTDIADYALEALRHSKVREVTILGRRGPAQAAFTPPEAKELAELEDCDTLCPPEEAALDPLSEASLADADRATVRNVQIIQEIAQRQPVGHAKRLTLRFLVSPLELYGDEQGKVRAMRIGRNKLVATDTGSLKAVPTGEEEMMEVGLVFRSIGYRGVPLPGVPFHDNWGVILNDAGRVLDPETRRPLAGHYTSGWIKRGPSGVIGTNKPDSVETVENMLADAAEGRTLQPARPTAAEAEAFIRERQPRYVSFADWQRVDALELALGKEIGRPRLKLTRIEELLQAAGR